MNGVGSIWWGFASSNPNVWQLYWFCLAVCGNVISSSTLSSLYNLQSEFCNILQHVVETNRGGISTTFLCLDAFPIEKKQVSRQLSQLYSWEGYTHHRSPQHGHPLRHFVQRNEKNFAAEYSKYLVKVLNNTMYINIWVAWKKLNNTCCIYILEKQCWSHSLW